MVLICFYSSYRIFPILLYHAHTLLHLLNRFRLHSTSVYYVCMRRFQSFHIVFLLYSLYNLIISRDRSKSATCEKKTEHQECRSYCAFAQSGQHICYSLQKKWNTFLLNSRNNKPVIVSVAERACSCQSVRKHPLTYFLTTILKCINVLIQRLSALMNLVYKNDRFELTTLNIGKKAAA